MIISFESRRIEMKYKNLADKIIRSIGATENILKIKKDKNYIVFSLWDPDLVNLNDLKELSLVKKSELENFQLRLKMRYRDINYTFDALKALPEAVVTVIPPPEEEINDKPFWQRMATSLYGDIFPLIIAMVVGGYLIGMITFVGRIFGS